MKYFLANEGSRINIHSPMYWSLQFYHMSRLEDEFFIDLCELLSDYLLVKIYVHLEERVRFLS